MKFDILPKNCFLLFSYTFILFALALTNGQSYSQYNCDQNRLQRCQQDITTNIQDISNSQSGSGYSGISSGYQSSSSDTHARCSAIRQNLDCLIMYTPACMNNTRTSYSGTSNSYGTVGNSYDNRNNAGDFIRRAKQTLERYCEQGGGGWKSASCYMRQDIRDCESRYSFQSNPPPVSSSSCRNYQDFRDCVIRIVRQSCYSQDLQIMATYLVDKGSDLSWSCVVNGDTYGGSGTYDNNRRYDNNYNPNDPNRPYDPNRQDSRYGGSGSYGGSYGGSGSSYGGSGSQYDRDRYDRDRDRLNDRNRYDQNYDRDRDRYGGSGGSYGGQTGTIDRFGGYYPTTDSCLEKSGYFVRSCEDTLVQRQRDAREGRSSTDVQRRICCALFFYRDCISRVVVDRCRDPSPTAVDILMGSRKRDLTTTCREYSRDQCSHSYTTKSSLITVLLSIVIAFKALKSNIF